MCSVVGYVGSNYSRAFVLEGLTRLEYRGYDSAGFSSLNPLSNRLEYAKSAGTLSGLIKKMDQTPIDGHVGIGHTRWSTHGVATEENAHPHFDCTKTVAVVHNGIVENHHHLREKLRVSGHTFDSQTDTEIIAHLFEDALATYPLLKTAVMAVVNQLQGAYAFIVIMESHPDVMIAVRKRSPLCVGLGASEMFVASDPLAFAGRTSSMLFLPDESFALIKKDSLELYDFFGATLPADIQELNLRWSANEKQGHEHFMLKEMYEQKQAISATVESLAALSDTLWNQLGLSTDRVRDLQSVTLIGSGTSWHAASIAQFFFEYVCMLPTQVVRASEFRSLPFFPNPNCLYVVVSQSGETADTLEALRMMNGLGLHTVAVTNVASSSMVREACGSVLMQAGQEVAVASTKSFSTQVATFFWLAHRIALEKGNITLQQMHAAESELLTAAHMLEATIERYKHEIITTHAKRYAGVNHAIFLGRHIGYPMALEAALKLQEISYIFAQCYPAGELKHGPLALIDEHTPTFIFSHPDPLIYQKLMANAQEVKARGGHVVAFAFEGQDELCEIADLAFVLPNVSSLLSPLVMTGVMQFLVYQIAKELGCAIDKPRNLAKSVTVE